MPNCYLCGSSPANKPLKLSTSFTDHPAARCPTSNRMCDRCAWAIPLRCWYWNPNQKKWSKLFSRNWSWLLSVNDSWPKFGSERSEGKDTLPVVTGLPTRALIRQWLMEPPEPPFTIAIAESGQKHILPWAVKAQSREFYPVMFEKDLLYINRASFCQLLSTYERLMALGFSKTEIDSGDYRSDRLISAVGQGFWELEGAIAQSRGTRLLQLMSFVATAADVDTNRKAS